MNSDFCAIIYSLAGDLRANFEMLDNVRKLRYVKKSLGSIAPLIESIFDSAKLPMASTRLVTATGVVAGVQKVSRDIKSQPAIKLFAP